MTLQPGATLGAYRITAQIGVGGMGEVYRASDARLGRDVAMKVLPTQWVADQDRMCQRLGGGPRPGSRTLVQAYVISMSTRTASVCWR